LKINNYHFDLLNITAYNLTTANQSDSSSLTSMSLKQLNSN